MAEDGEGGKILIGKDTRISGYMFEAALEAGLAAAGVDAAKVVDDLATTVGQTGSPHAGLVLASALDEAEPGAWIVGNALPKSPEAEGGDS